jgi:hypothetical protein
MAEDEIDPEWAENANEQMRRIAGQNALALSVLGRARLSRSDHRTWIVDTDTPSAGPLTVKLEVVGGTRWPSASQGTPALGVHPAIRVAVFPNGLTDRIKQALRRFFNEKSPALPPRFAHDFFCSPLGTMDNTADQVASVVQQQTGVWGVKAMVEALRESPNP